MARKRKIITDENVKDFKRSKEEIAKRKAEQVALEEFEQINEEIPNYLDHMAKIEYKRIVELMRDNLPVSELDKTMLATFCMTYSHWRKLNRDILKHGAVMIETDEDGNELSRRVNPSWNAMLKAQSEMRQLANQLGLTMNSRMQLVIPDEEDEEDEVLKIIRGG